MRRRVLLMIMALWAALAGDAHAFESHTLENGLEVFLEQSRIVPLVTIRITFRAGAIVETPELNGLCHLYEHMLFKGNQLNPNQAAFKAALKRMGAGSWNGGTSTEYVTYYITIPSDRVEQGLLFWASAVRNPLLRKDELLKEREVVHNEIAGDQSKPEYFLRREVIRALYPEHYSRREVGGDLAVIDTATVAKMKFIKDNYYVPNNAALFISGDIDPKAVLKHVRTHFGSWKRGPALSPPPGHKPLTENRWVAVATSPTRGIVNVRLVFRGPDTGVDTASTYAADVWGYLINNPAGRFKNTLYKAVPELYGGTRYIGGGYFTQRDGGETSFSFSIDETKTHDLWEVITRLRRTVEAEIAGMLQENYFTPAQIAAAKQEIRNQDILSRETSAGFMSNLSFWWASTSTGYYQTYLQQIESVTVSHINAFLATYLQHANYLTSIWLHPDDDKKHGIVRKARQEDPKR